MSSRSPSPDLNLSESPPKLDPSVLALLNQFITEREDEERRFKALEAEHVAATIAGVIGAGPDEEKGTDIPIVSLAEYKKAFGEDWQLSQFWYSDSFATRTAEAIHAQCSEDTKIAFLCCPTAFVAFQNVKQLKEAYVFEVDQRFAVLSPTQYIFYDLDEPNAFPERFEHYFDFVVVDPPFLNEVTNRKISTTLRQIMKSKDSKLLLLTSTSVEDVVKQVYDEPPVGPLKRTALVVEHGQLANDFASWGSWEGAENFGK
ncbi:hypothetical protein H1R20_g14715, partial [Candolleomyces eurysporus]